MYCNYCDFALFSITADDLPLIFIRVSYDSMLTSLKGHGANDILFYVPVGLPYNDLAIFSISKLSIAIQRSFTWGRNEK